MSAQKPAATTANAANIQPADQIGAATLVGGDASIVSPAPKAKAITSRQKKKEPVIADSQEWTSDNAGAGDADLTIVAQAGMAARGASDSAAAEADAADKAAGSEAGADGAAGTAAESGSSGQAVKAGAANADQPATSAAADAAAEAATEAGGFVGAAAAAGGVPGIWALPLLALAGAGGGGGGGGGSAVPVPAGDSVIPSGSAILGAVIDGYVSGARIYVDVNGNGTVDLAEDTGLLTDSTGHFSGTTTMQGALIAVGGTNIDTGLPNTLVLMAPAGSTVITPLTTLAQMLVSSTGVSAAQAEAAIEASLLLPNIDMMNFDPLSAASATDAIALAIGKVNAQVAMIATLAEAFHPGSGAAVMQSMVSLIAAGGTLDLTSTAGLNAINAGAGGLLTAAEIASMMAGTTDIALDTTLDSASATSIANTQMAILNVLTVAEAEAQLQVNPSATFSLYDTAANLAAAPLAVGNGAFYITSSDLATAVQAAAIEAYTNSGTNSYSLVAAGPSTLTGAVTEDGTLSASGALAISALDSNNQPAAFGDVAGAAGDSGYGSFAMSGGVWTYTLDNNGAVVQALSEGQVVSDTHTFTASDGSQQTVQVTIAGTNDAAVLSSATVALDETNAALSTGGTLTVSDVDSAAAFVAQTDVAGVNGIFSIDAAGAWTYTANSAFDNLNVGDSVSDTFTVAAADGTTTSVAVTITGTDDAAVLSSATVALDETDAALSTGGTLTISDADSAVTDAFVAQTGVAGVNGLFSIDAAGAWTYTANSAFDNLNVGDSVSDTFTVAAADGTTTSVQVTIAGTNDAAVLSSATVALDETDAALSTGGTLTVSDVDSAAAFVAQTGVAGLNGLFSIDAAGAWTYTANSAFDNLNVGDSVSDTFTVAAADGTTTSVAVTISGTNDAAVLSSATVALDETDAALATGGTLTFTDVDDPVAPATFVPQTDVAGVNGIFSVDANGVWSYTANSAFDALNVGDSVSDTFTVAKTDGATTTVQVTISGTNDAAVLSSATVALDETNAALSTGGTLTVSDVDSAAAFVAQTGVAGVNGIFSIDAAGAWTYTANSALDSLNVGQSASDTFTVSAADGTTTSVAVTISGTNDAAVLSSATVALDETNAALSTGGTLTVSDIDSLASFVAQTDVAGLNGLFSIDASGAWTYTANSAFDNLNVGGSVSDTFTVAAADGTTTSVAVTISGTNDAAVLSSATVALDETNAALSTGGTLTISDVDNPVTDAFVAQTGVAGVNGLFSVDANGAWTYTANSAFDNLNVGDSVSDTFTVASTDGTTTAVQVTITGTNDAAVISGTSTGLVVEASGAANAVAGTPTATGTLTDTDVDNPANTFTAVATPAASTGGLGTYTMTSDGVWTYTLNNDHAAVQALRTNAQTLTDTFTVTAVDGTAQLVTVTIQGENDAPVAVADVGAAVEAGGVANGAAGTDPAGNVLTNDTDVDSAANGETQAVTAIAGGTVGGASVGTFGTLTLNADGSYTYAVDNANAAVQALRTNAQTLTDTFTYTVADAAGATSSTTLEMAIQGANDAPVAVADVATAVEAGGAANGAAGTDPAGNVLTNDTDVDSAANGETKAVTAIAGGTVGGASVGTFGTLTLNADGSYAYAIDNANAAVQALNVGQTLNDSFTYTMADAAGAASSTTLAVTIEGANDAAVVGGTSAGAVSEQGGIANAIAGTPVASGTLTVSDVDSAATFVAVGTPTASTGGMGTFTMTAEGAWTYTLDNANAAVDVLNSGQTLNDTFTVTTADGTQQVVTVAIDGTTDLITVAQASALLGANPNATYALADTSANLLAAPANVTSAVHASILVATDPVTVANHNALAALNPNIGYGLSDLSSELLANPATVSGATAILANPAVTVIDPVLIADAQTLLALNANTVYALSDLSFTLLLFENAALVSAATAVELFDFVAVADANALLALNPNTSYILMDTAAELLAPANAATVGAAGTVFVLGPVSVAEANSLLAVNFSTLYDLVDTAANMLADQTTLNAALTVEATAATVADADSLLAIYPSALYSLNDTSASLLALGSEATVGAALQVTAAQPVTVADADSLLLLNPNTVYDVSDTAVDLAAAFSTASPSLLTVDNVANVDVSDLGGVLNLDADQFGNFLTGPTLLAATDTIAIDGAVDFLADLGTLDPFGGDVLAGITLGGSQNGSYIVDLGTSGAAQIVMEGLGQHQITASLTTEMFVVGVTSAGGSSISNLGIADQVNVGADGTALTTNVATAADVDVAGEWNFDGAALTWFAAANNQAETLALQFSAGTNLQLEIDQQTFTVI